MIETSAPVFFDRLDDAAEHRQLDVIVVFVLVRHGCSGLAGVDAAEDLGAGLEHPRGVRGRLAAGDALDDDLAVLGQKDCHCQSFQALRGFGRFGGSHIGGFVHGAHLGHEWVVRLGQDAAALVDVVAVQADHQRLVGLVAEDLERVDDAVGDRVARGDAAEHVDEHALDLRVVQDDVEAGGHHLRRGAAADVEEVGRLDAAVLLTGVGDDVQRRHHQPRAVADDADLAVELDVVEVVLLGLELQRICGVAVFELRVVGMTEVGVGVEGDLAVQRQDLIVGRAHQRVDLHQRGVLLDEDLPQLGDGHCGGIEHLGGQVALFGDRAGERRRRHP